MGSVEKMDFVWRLRVRPMSTTNVYSPYGYRSAKTASTDALGFNGQFFRLHWKAMRSEMVTGYTALASCDLSARIA